MKIVKRILLWLFGLILLLIVALFGSIFVDGFFAQGRLDALTNTTLPASDGTPIRAYLSQPTGDGPHPTVIMIHEFYGLRPDIISKADDLAKQGYLVIAPNLYRNGTTNWIPSAIFKVMRTDTTQIDGDLDAVFAWLTTQPEVQADRIAIMGFCFGGGTSLRYSLSNNQLAATAVFYGQPITDPAKLKSLSGPVLGIFGGADGSIPVEEVQALEKGLNEAGIQNQITIYDGQPHAFVGGMDEIAQGGPAQQAWNQLLDFLKQNLQAGHPPALVHTLTHQEAAAGEFSLAYVWHLALSHFGHIE